MFAKMSFVTVAVLFMYGASLCWAAPLVDVSDPNFGLRIIMDYATGPPTYEETEYHEDIYKRQVPTEEDSYSTTVPTDEAVHDNVDEDAPTTSSEISEAEASGTGGVSSTTEYPSDTITSEKDPDEVLYEGLEELVDTITSTLDELDEPSDEEEDESEEDEDEDESEEEEEDEDDEDENKAEGNQENITFQLMKPVSLATTKYVVKPVKQ